MRTPNQSDSQERSSNEPRSDRGAASSGLVPLQPISDASPAHPTDDVPTIIKGLANSPSPEQQLGLHPGMKLGHYELMECIGTGGMASVLKARDLQLSRLVALKILPPQMARDPDNVQRFKNEARAAARLDHDNIARVFFCGEDQGLHFIAFEFVEGDNLRMVMERVGRLSPAEAVRYLLQISAGLAHAADRGVVHRDIKPSNILITPDGRAKIVDMGLARTLSHQSVNGGVTQSGMTLGTFDYISPEQALDPRKADIRSDIYSLGCTFYHALTGRPPVPEGTAAKKLQAHQNESILDPRELNSLISDEFAIVLARMMAKSPAQRFQSPQELIAALTVLARQLNLTAETAALDPSLLPSNPSRIVLMPPPPRFPVGLVIGLAALSLLAILLVIGNRAPTRTPGTSLVEEFSPPPRPAIDTPPTSAPPPPTRATQSGLATAATPSEFLALLNDPAIHTIRLLAEQRYDLKQLAPQGVSLSGRRLTIEGPGGNAPATIRLAMAPLDPLSPLTARPGTLTLAKTDKVLFRGIQFILAEAPPQQDALERAVGLHLEDIAEVDFQECRFEADKDLQSVDLAAISFARASTANSSPVTFRDCLFNFRRGYGVQLTGAFQVKVLECAGAPHPAVFALSQRVSEEPGSEMAASELVLQHCSWAVDRGAVAEVEDGARWVVNAGYCVFFQPPQPGNPPGMMTELPERRPAVLRLLSDKLENTLAQLRGRIGEPNAYYRIDPLAVRLKGYSLEEAGRLAPQSVQDIGAIELKQSPIVTEDFLTEIQRPEPWSAFRLKANYQPLQVPRSTVGLLGARFLPTRELQQIYPAWPPPVQVETLEANVKVWWPQPPDDKRDSLPRNIFTELDAALAALRPGDELRIRHNGLINVMPQTLNKPRLRASIKPEPGYKPILLLADNQYAEPSFFRMVDGDELTLDGLDFRLMPRSPRDSGKTQAVVILVGGSRTLNFRNCCITLDPEEDEKLAAVMLTQPAGGEMRTTSDRRPAVRIENCFVRGRGRVCSVPIARAFELDLNNCLTVLTGPVIEVDANTKLVSDGQVSRLGLSNVTAALGGPLLELRPGATQNGKLPGWIPLDVEAERCLFSASDRGVPVIRVEGGEARDPSAVLTWQSRGTNWYANFTRGASLMEWNSLNDPLLSQVWEPTAWLEWIQEKEDTSFGRVSFQSLLSARRPVTAVPVDFDIKSVGMMSAVGIENGVKISQIPAPFPER